MKISETFDEYLKEHEQFKAKQKEGFRKFIRIVGDFELPEHTYLTVNYDGSILFDVYSEKSVKELINLLPVRGFKKSSASGYVRLKTELYNGSDSIEIRIDCNNSKCEMESIPYTEEELKVLRTSGKSTGKCKEIPAIFG